MAKKPTEPMEDRDCILPVNASPVLETDDVALVRKLAQIAGELTYVQKTGKNTFQNYSFAKEGDFKAALKPLLAREGIHLSANCRVVGNPIHIGNSGKTDTPQWMTTVEMTGCFTYRTATLEVCAIGQGVDPGDKGVYKAQAGALKYLIATNFQIPTGDDPENPNDVDQGSTPATPKPPAAPSRPAAPAPTPSPAPAAAPRPAPSAAPQQAPGEHAQRSPEASRSASPSELPDEYRTAVAQQIERLGSEKVFWVAKAKFGAEDHIGVPEAKRNAYIKYLRMIDTPK